MRDASVVLGELAEEFTARVREGRLPNVEEYAQQHPELAERIRELFPALLFLEGMAGGAARAESMPSPDAALAPGMTFGNYRIVREVGRGGMGVVYEAVHMALARRVALKVLPIRGTGSAGQLERFLREARTAAGLHHTNIVPVFDVGQVAGTPYYAMQFIEGHGLDRVLRRPATGSPTVPEGEAPGPVEAVAAAPPVTTPPTGDYFRWVADLGAQAAEGLAYAHRRGVVHRDIKPANLLLDPQGVLWITDFGLARRLDDPSLTHPGALLGTPRYMSPEQAEAAQEPVDHRTDIYSLGATLYELLTQRPAFDGATPQEVVRLIVSREPVAPRRLNPAVPSDLETVVLKAMAKRPAERYATAQDLADDLRRWLRLEPIRARRVGLVGRAVRWCRRNPAEAALSAALVLLLLAGTVVSSYFAVQARDRAREAEANAVLAQHERDRADASARTAIARAYTADLRLVQRAAEDVQASRVLALLDEQRPEHTGAQDLRGFEWYYWDTWARSCLQRIPAHSADVLGVAFSPDGHRLASCGKDRTVKIWETATGRLLHTWPGHTHAVQRVAFSPDGRWLAAATGDEVVEQRSSVYRGDVRVWDFAVGQERFTLRDLGWVSTVAFSPDGKLLASAGSDPRIRLWDAATGREVRSLEGHTDWVTRVAFSPDGKLLASAGSDDSVRVWDLAGGQPPRVLSGIDSGGINDLAFSPDGTRLVLAAGGNYDDGQVGTWDLQPTSEVAWFTHVHGACQSVTFGPGADEVAAGGWGATKIWSHGVPMPMHILGDPETSVNQIALSPNRRRLAEAGTDGVVRLWSLPAEPEAITLNGHDGRVNSLAATPDGRRVLSAGWDGTARLWDMESGQEMQRFPADSWACAALSPDGRRLATNQADSKDVVVRDLASGKEVLTLHGHTGSVWCLLFSPDGGRLASVAEHDGVRVWDLATGRPVATRLSPDSQVISLAFTPDGRRLATADYNGQVRVWDLAADREVFGHKAHPTGALSVAFSPDGTLLASTGYDSLVRLWDAATGKEVRLLRGHTGAVHRAAFSPDGRRLVSGGADQMVRVWDVALGQELLRLQEHSYQITCVAFGPDGRVLLSADEGGWIKLWDARPWTDEARLQREAFRAYQAALEQALLQEELIPQLRQDPTLDEAVRQRVLAWAEHFRPRASDLNEASWKVVHRPDATPESYRQALRRSEKACELDPDDTNYQHALGVALYRTGAFERALEVLARADARQEKALVGANPHFLAFQAMAQFRLGKTEPAQATLQRLRDVMRSATWADDLEAQESLRETEALLAGKPVPPRP